VTQETTVSDTNAPDRRPNERLFHRDLPGGGFVAIDITVDPSGLAPQARVLVERRRDRARRDGHHPPVIHECEWRPERGFEELYRLACDNVAIARRLLRHPRAD